MSNGPAAAPAPPNIVDAVISGAGLIIPASASEGRAGTSDIDGRRRVVVLRDDARRIQRAIRILKDAGFTILLRCDDARPIQTDGEPAPCGELLNPEGHDTPDNGFGCRCSRIHLGR